MSPITTRMHTKRSLASLIRMSTSNHHHTVRQKLNPGGARRPPSSKERSSVSETEWFGCKEVFTEVVFVMCVMSKSGSRDANPPYVRSPGLYGPARLPYALAGGLEV